jgi:glycosyltransferase 2 family protein
MWRLALKGAISAALLGLLLRHRDIGALAAQMEAVGPAALLGGAVLVASGATLLAARWSVILGALGASRGLGVTVPLLLVGRFFGQVLPSNIGGDVVRIWLACKAGLTPAVSISSVMADRLIGLLTVLLLVTAEMPAVVRMSPGSAVIGGLALLLIAGYGGCLVALVLDRLPARLARFRIVRGFRQFARDLRAILLRPRPAALAILCGGLCQVCDSLAVFTLAQGLGLAVGFADCLVIVPLANLVQAVPISIGGWGVREGFFVAAFGMTGLAAPDALAVSILLGLVNLVVSLPGGVLWLRQKDALPRDAAAAKAAEPAAGG